jgi:EAL domain-containing protein (putative c-di-GMP-specific phosphodiesterase class I)
MRGARSMAGGRRHVRFQREMRAALDHDELVLHYQPKVDLKTGAVMGTEALVRWQHPEHGLLSPDKFIPRAEETGLIEPLTVRVFELALGQAKRWRDAGVDLPPIAVNFSPITLGDPALADKLNALLQRHEVAAADVVIEMTESAMAQNAAVSHGVLAALDHLGFRLSIDDFGTGYSSLARLDQLPLSEMKVDRSFVARIAEGGSSRLVMTMIDLAHDLGMQVVGEGVESQEIADVLAQSGCDIAQGFHFARPMPADDLAGWLRARGASGAGGATSARSPSPSAPA